MDFVYLLMNGSEWEDIVVILSQDDAIKASIDKPNSRVEIFSKNTKFGASRSDSEGERLESVTLVKDSGYTPTYNYYKNGEYIQYK